MASISLNYQSSIEVSTGEVKVASAGIALTASALGSCIAVIACAPEERIGGIAHVMLPGRAQRAETKERFRYAGDAIERLLAMMCEHGASPAALSVCLAGAANVLRRDDDVICAMNMNSVYSILAEYALPVEKRCLGGFLRRRVAFDIASGRVFCAMGDEEYRLLHVWSGPCVPSSAAQQVCGQCSPLTGTTT